jgi:hypothetical protein
VQGLNIARLLGAILKSSADLDDATFQRAVRDVNIAPDRVQQFMLGDEASRTVRDVEKNREGLACQRDLFGATAQTLALPVMRLHCGGYKNVAWTWRHYARSTI